MSREKPRVVVLGGGFAGLATVKALKGADAEVVLIDKQNHHLFQPLLYQVATAGLNPSDIASPLRGIVSKQKNTRVMLGSVESISRANRRVQLESGCIDYDFLVVATGMVNNYFGHDEWEEHAPGLKTLEEATDLRRKMLLAFEAAEFEDDPDEVKALLTFVVVGGGPTGVEMAGALAEIGKEVLRNDFSNIDPEKVRVVLIEGQDELLGAMSDESSESALKQITAPARQVEVRLNTFVSEINARGVRAGDEFILSRNVIWAAGLKASPLTQSLNTELDRAGRAIVTPRLHLPEDERVYVIGDLAHFDDPEHGVLPGLAPVAMQQGAHAGKNIGKQLKGGALTAFSYFDKGTMATIGRKAAVAEVPMVNIKLSGFLAWVAWLFIHLMFLVGFRNQFAVLSNWIYSYVVMGRSARLIIDPEASMLGRRLLHEAPESLEGPHQFFTENDGEDVGKMPEEDGLLRGEKEAIERGELTLEELDQAS